MQLLVMTTIFVSQSYGAILEFSQSVIKYSHKGES
jgi:hypothetical protein